MQKKYIVRLTGEERGELQEVLKKLKGTSQKVRRAQLLLKADAEGPAWGDSRIAEAFACRRQTVERLRQRFVKKLSVESNEFIRPPRSGLMENRKPASSPCVWAPRRRDMPTGRSGC
jgi:hypothetical protein